MSAPNLIPHIRSALESLRPAERSFRRNMPRHQSSRRTAESSVSQKRNRISKPFAHNRGRYSEHLSHSRPALRAFIANHNHIASLQH